MRGNPVLYLWLVVSAGIGYLAATQGFGAVPGFIPILAILFIAFPSLRAFMRVHGFERGFAALILLGIFAFTVESIGVATGYPYGSFEYTGELGWRLFGLVPWTIPFAWIPLLLGSIALSSINRHTIIRGSLMAATLLTVMDLVLDPAAVSVGLWRYMKPGFYYGIPWTNFVGWMLVGTCASIVLTRFLKETTYPPEMALSAASMMAFWSAVALVNQLWVPAVIGLALMIFISYRYERRS